MRFRVSFSVIMFSVTLANTVQAAILFDNGTAVAQDLGLRYNYDQWSIFDDFVLTEESIVTGIRWTQFDEQQVSYASTTLFLFDGLPKPSSLISTINVVANRTTNGLMLSTNKTPSAEAFGVDYTASGLSQSLSAGTYFIGIHNDVSGGVTMIANSLGGGNSIFGFYQQNGGQNNNPLFALTESGPNHSNNGYTAFSVEGSVVPEPTTLDIWSVLGVTFGVGTWWKRRRTAA